MRCPFCGSSNHVNMKSPDYGRGAEFVCYKCDVYGRRFSSNTPGVDRAEAARASSESRAQSAANAEEYRAKAGRR